MCLAILQRAGATVPYDRLVNAAQANPDGCGYAYTNGDAVVVRNFLTWEEMAPEYVMDLAQFGATSAFLIHFRWATHGEITVDNCHPFHMDDGGALIHNGVMSIKGLPKGMSDTKFFTKNIISKLPAAWHDQAWWKQVMEEYIGKGNKVACLWPDGRTLILNEDQGHWDQGVWYSNCSYEPGYGMARAFAQEDAWWRDLDDTIFDDPDFACEVCMTQLEPDEAYLDVCPYCESELRLVELEEGDNEDTTTYTPLSQAAAYAEFRRELAAVVTAPPTITRTGTSRYTVSYPTV